MQTILIKLDASKLENPDLDLRYILPDRIEEISEGRIKDDGYDYLTEQIIGLWLKTECAAESYPEIVTLIKLERFSNNDLSLSAQIYISEKDVATMEECQLVYG